MAKENFLGDVIHFSPAFTDVKDVVVSLLEGAESGEIQTILVITSDIDGADYIYSAGVASRKELAAMGHTLYDHFITPESEE